ncbi:uncharacterized protein FOMMEDRAFT_119898 [Fomitiporia mediterranea MF3/22]|uniref:uncharacterized protein n=1 Tax=Fomitiporia mediterranea (strain MF3/22) TaxID=694068 RepID=UPI0004407551|nr:uncharacterized protein FOMMEDRAFT_119898 [Fomitiporia mediterranea MF3/22]EJD04692.1 hypothetical protein FOMMEDRAFT_119898 [Fomitiporia mediterranea MF3/22]
MLPILSSICATNAPASLQYAGFDVLAAYCSCGTHLATSDRLTFFDILQSTLDGNWNQEVWESRLKAMNALTPTLEDVLGIEKLLLGLLSGWLRQAFEDYCSKDADRQERERPVETLSDALIEWFSRLEESGRLPEEQGLSFFEFYQSLVDYALRLPLEDVQHSTPPTPTPPTSQRDSSNTTFARHRRHPSSITSVPSPLSPLSPNIRTHSPPVRGPVQFASSIYLNFLNSRLKRLPLSFLPSLMPLLLRILSAVMSPLPPLSPGITKRNPVEHRVLKTITALLTGPYATTCLILLRQLLLPVPGGDVVTQVRTSLGALRALRQQIRTVLEDRMAMRIVQRGTSSSATPSGAPASAVVLDDYLIERAQRAWTKEGAAVWDARKVSFFLVKAIQEWNDTAIPTDKERILEEIAGLLHDVLQEMDDRFDDQDFLAGKDFHDADTGGAVGRTLHELMKYVKGLRNEDGMPMILPLSNAFAAPTPFLRALADCFGHKQSLSYIDPPVSLILLSVVDHLLDIDSERIPLLMVQQHLLKPTSFEWLGNWEQLLRSTHLFMQTRPRTRRASISALHSVFSLVRDMQGYRRPLMDYVFNFWTQMVSGRNEGGDGSTIWRLLGEEAVLRATEDDIDDLFTPTQETTPDISSVTVHMILAALAAASTYCECDGEIEVCVKPVEVPPASPMVPMTPSNTVASNLASPILPRVATETQAQPMANMQQQLLSLLSFSSPRNQSQNQVPQVSSPDDILTSSSTRADRSPLSRESPEPITVPVVCRGLTAVSALCEVFLKLAFIDSLMTTRQSRLAIYVFGQLLRLLRTAHCPRARIAVLQTLTRLRADRDHRVYFARAPEEQDQQILSLARLVGRLRDSSAVCAPVDEARAEEIFLERARAAQVLDRDGRRASRGRGSRRSGTVSRSRSRAPGHTSQSANSANVRPRDQLWAEPDVVPFSLDNADKGSQRLVTYDPIGPNDAIVLPVSDYMDELVEIIKTDRDWEVLSYVLVHLPAQLANKHFWCGPIARESISKLLAELCQSIKANTLGKYVNQEEWPTLSKSRDAIGLAYHTLTVLISYNTIFDPAKRKTLLDILQMGLSGKGDTVIICTHALNLCVYEMETTVVKELPSILEKLTQIVSNPSIAVHILTFLGNLNSLPNIYSNFTHADYKLVFAVALQYLQHHNRLETSREMPFSLSQHVRIMSYYVLYMWFLSLKLEDRAQHVPFIVRQLLLANNDEDRNEIDVPTEVAFDLLARYTYANADSKPAQSLLGDILSKPSEGAPDNGAIQEKSWVMGYSIVTVRLLAKSGWLEVTTRRPSGTTRFLCKSENVPLVNLGDLDPDMVTIPASLMMDKDPSFLRSILSSDEATESSDEPSETSEGGDELANQVFKLPDEAGENVARPDPVKGYVWTGSAPSQRRKRVDLDPSFFPLQFSPYPDTKSIQRRGRIVRDTRALASAIRTLDRIPVIDTHKVGILYVGPGQTDEIAILRNTRGSPAYARFLEGLARLIKVRGQLDVYTGGLDPDEDGEYAFAWWDDVGQVLYHTATMMPNCEDDERCNFKKRHIGNDLVRIVWNDSGLPYRFDTLSTEFQFVNIVIEPHSRGAIAAYSDNKHENEYFKLIVQCAEGMAEFAPIGDFKIVSAKSLSILVRQLSLVADWYASIFKDTVRDTERNEIVTNWRARLETIKKFASTVPSPYENVPVDHGVMGMQASLDFTPGY